MCTEPLFNYKPYLLKANINKPSKRSDYKSYLQRHIIYNTENELIHSKVRAALQFWVEWHSYLNLLNIPVFQVEHIQAKTIFDLLNLSTIYNNNTIYNATFNNHRSHQDIFTWQELYTASPYYTKQVYQLAQSYGYYQNNQTVDQFFKDFKCLQYFPTCNTTQTLNIYQFCPYENDDDDKKNQK